MEESMLEEKGIPHLWENTKHGRMYDTYKCVKCGITAKRFCLSKKLKKDRKYKGIEHKFCKREISELQLSITVQL